MLKSSGFIFNPRVIANNVIGITRKSNNSPFMNCYNAPSRVISALYHFNIIANKKFSSFTSGGGADRTQLTIYE